MTTLDVSDAQKSLAVGGERLWSRGRGSVCSGMRACWLAGLARSFQDPAARYFMALRGSQVTCPRVGCSCHGPVSFQVSLFLKCHGGP
jgi:hypothetical protein